MELKLLVDLAESMLIQVESWNYKNVVGFETEKEFEDYKKVARDTVNHWRQVLESEVQRARESN